jgi:hypothetical protein
MKKIILSIIFFAFITSCKKSGNIGCPYNSTGGGRYVFAPDSAHVDSSIIISQIWENDKPCQIPKGFQATVNGNIRELFLNTIVDTCNCANSTVLPYANSYSFTVHKPGIQIVKTQTKPGFFQTDTIIVY